MRRLEMGEAAGLFADEIILTNDNPREENPEKIIRDIIEGIKKAEEKTADNEEKKMKIIMDRRMAVAEAIREARTGDVVLIAGKGHEKYQEIHGVRYYMDDHELVREAMWQRELMQKRELLMKQQESPGQ